MINYSSYNDAWGITPNNKIQKNDNELKDNFTNIEKSIEIKKNNETFTNIKSLKNKEKCHKTCNIVEDIINCPKCLELLKKKLNMNSTIKETFKNKIEGFNSKVKNKLIILCDTKNKKNTMLILLILLFLILSFYFVKGRGIDSKDSNIQDLSEAVSDATLSMKYLKENFIMIPKNMINFNNNIINPNL
tara:strand:+ start:362 stop:928 length:567 start_codon:yes stop_codon:yes gene_type:complete